MGLCRKTLLLLISVRSDKWYNSRSDMTRLYECKKYQESDVYDIYYRSEAEGPDNVNRKSRRTAAILPCTTERRVSKAA